MSWPHLKAISLMKLADARSKAVLIALAFHANEFSGKCFPGLERLTLFTCLSRSTVQRAIKDLKQLGLITVIPGSGKKSSSYLLKIPGVPFIDQARLDEQIIDAKGNPLSNQGSHI